MLTLKELQARAAKLGMVLERKKWYSKQFGTNYSLYCNNTFTESPCKNLTEVELIVKMREVEAMAS